MFEGAGLGYRRCYYDALMSEASPYLSWLEILADNFLNASEQALESLSSLGQRYSLVCHSVNLSLGSVEALNENYVASLSRLIEASNAQYFSDHLCWTSCNGKFSHDLLPLPMNTEVVMLVSDKIKRLQDEMQRPFLIENISSYVRTRADTLTEWEMLNHIAHRADCGLLIDVNNIYVNAINHGVDPEHFIRAIDRTRVKQIHMAGHYKAPHYCVDTHGAEVSDPVWYLYEYALDHFGPVPTNIERDQDYPPFEVLMDEVRMVASYLSEAKEREQEGALLCEM